MIRMATPDDAPSVAALMIQVWLHTYATDGVNQVTSEYVLREFTAENLARAMASPGLLHLVMEQSKHIVGVAVIDWNGVCPASKRALPELQKLYVQEHFTGRGLGSRLLDHALQQCRARGFLTLGLTVLAMNARAVGFYRKHGFLQVGVTDWVLGGEAYANFVLHKELA